MTGDSAAARAAPRPGLTAENLACRRGGRIVFVGVSFVLSPGGALVLTGANGSGKSSLLRLAAGLLVPAAGRLTWDTASILDDAAAHHARLHYVGHQDALKPALTPREMLTFWAALHGARRRRAAPTVDRALAMFALEAVADWPCRWLSAGQRRKAALARLLATPAPLWLLDEPTSALDADGRARLERVIADHRAAGGLAMVATHEPVALPDAAGLVLDRFAPVIDDLDPHPAE